MSVVLSSSSPTNSDIIASRKMARDIELSVITRRKLESLFTPAVLKHMSASAHTGRIELGAKHILAVASFVNMQRMGSYAIDKAHVRIASVKLVDLYTARPLHLAAKPFVLQPRDLVSASESLGLPVDISSDLSGGMRYECTATKTRKEKRNHDEIV